MTKSVVLQDSAKCIDWYLKEIASSSLQPWMFTEPRLMCPCTQSFMQFEFFWRVFSNDSSTACYATIRYWPMSAICCYPATNMNGGRHASTALAGSYVSYNPIWPSTKGLYNSNEKERKRQCCGSDLCNLYYEVRPVTECYTESQWTLGLFWGDPHIETLDGLKYTFNGFGEYTMLGINNENASFELQARTDLASNENGSLINATIFSAFVAKDHTGSTLQVELSNSKLEMVIYGNGVDFTNQFYNDKTFLVLGENLTLSKESDTIIGSFTQSDVVIKISVGTRLLILETVVSINHKGQTFGLMGNFDGNETNDFILPNGTELERSCTNTERNIFYNFGQAWSVNSSTSLFEYTKGTTHENYNHPEFVPFFVDEFPSEQQEAARSQCGGSSASQSCIFDYLATGDISLAIESGATVSKIEQLKVVMANQPPVITGDEKIHVKVGETTQLQFSASDDDSYTFRILSSPRHGFTFNQSTGVANWIPQDADPASISITAVDNSSLEASPIDVEIVLCTGCSGNGVCNYNWTKHTTEPLFLLATCTCNVGWSGDECDKDTDSCVWNPCMHGTNCTDLTPDEESALGRGFNCSACPMGYLQSGPKCKDIDECSSNTTNDCDHVCMNTIGGYKCACRVGYRLDGLSCKDINECTKRTDRCEHICVNEDGGFKCSCFHGYSLLENNATCIQEMDMCSPLGLSCEYGCTNSTNGTVCICSRGYRVAENGINCTNIDECLHSPCEQLCTDTEGSFNCSCRSGFSLDKDKTSCIECQAPYYGENCEETCICGQGSDRCDPVEGCVCSDGWTGLQCDEDIDECTNHTDPCNSDLICVNHAGYYECQCGDGFEKHGNFCIDINECSDDSRHNCSETTSTCQNINGSFSCQCREGYSQVTAYTCTDVNECFAGYHGCNQLCINVEGTYNCECEPGFKLDDDRKTCKLVQDVCGSLGALNCSYGCKMDGGAAFCFCQSGYTIDVNNNQTCIDIDECGDSELNLCSNVSSCTNKIGTYTCSCGEGYFLDNDGRTCIACDQVHSSKCFMRDIDTTPSMYSSSYESTGATDSTAFTSITLTPQTNDTSSLTLYLGAIIGGMVLLTAIIAVTVGTLCYRSSMKINTSRNNEYNDRQQVRCESKASMKNEEGKTTGNLLIDIPDKKDLNSRGRFDATAFHSLRETGYDNELYSKDDMVGYVFYTGKASLK